MDENDLLQDQFECIIHRYQDDVEDCEVPRQIQLQSCYPATSVITEVKRTILLNWLLEVILCYKLNPETWLRTIAILERFAKLFPLTTDQDLQNYGLVCCFIAIKIEERIILKASNFADMSDNGFTSTELISYEIVILKTLDFNLPDVHSVTILHLLTKLTETESRKIGQLSCVKVDQCFDHFNYL